MKSGCSFVLSVSHQECFTPSVQIVVFGVDDFVPCSRKHVVFSFRVVFSLDVRAALLQDRYVCSPILLTAFRVAAGLIVRVGHFCICVSI